VTVDRYWCELAVVDGAVRPAVLVEVEAGRFRTITPAADAPSGARPLAGLTIPGMANTHSHAFHRALRSRTQAGRGDFWTWRELMYAAAARLDPDSYHRLARATFAEMAQAGVAAVGEFHYVHHQPDGTPYADPNAMGRALLDAAADAGIRITLLDAAYLRGGLGADGHLPLGPAQRRFADADADAWAGRVDALCTTATQRVGAAIHSVRAVDPTAMAIVAEWAGARGAVVHAHVSEQVAENDACRAAHGTSPTGLLAAAGVLSERFSAVHATHVDDADVERLAASGASVAICPTTERDLGDGIGPTDRLARAGVPLTLGSDSHAVIDLLEEARAVELDERLRSGRRGGHSTSELLAMATADGHRSLGWSAAGTIAAGNRADLVTVALDSVRTAGAAPAAALEAVVFAATAADVTDVVVDGRVIVAEGRHVTIETARELDAAVRELIAP
jgi:formiminoglutamate deiminase